ncbi:uncharacterized protein LOC119616491 [Lucilia sericata]|uniref:uncharacterized protein LOC119616491 n=1 Tax=Lucilia sericata TaxID=13632 RepID=UPI0018A87D3F|nr:uncharacterized protein LOC119616491 [Lucilia sericata]
MDRALLWESDDNSNIMDINENAFVKKFRLNKVSFMYVFNSIKDDLKAAQRSTFIPSMLKLAAALKFLPQGEVCEAIQTNLCTKHIVFEMCEEKKMEAKRFLNTKCSIPGVIGTVDGTHIQIIRPNNNEHLYFNRKQKHSINAMARLSLLEKFILRRERGVTVFWAFEMSAKFSAGSFAVVSISISST